MRYILMCGGNYKHWEKPRHLSIIQGEEVVARTIRLLRENGIKDISISSNNPIFEKFGVPILKHDNLYNCKWHDIEEGYWWNCFYPTDEPVCYILGDVVFSPEAIKKIIETKTDDIELFGSMPPFANEYIKDHIEAFALKVANQKHLHKAIKKAEELDKKGKFWRKPIIWELWTVIKNVPLQTSKNDCIYNWTKINDYTCDIDWEEDIRKFNIKLGGIKMIKVEAIKDFTLEKYNELEDIIRKNPNNNQDGKLCEGDTFKCTKEMCDYLTGGNEKSAVVVKVIEVIPEIDPVAGEIKIKKVETKQKTTKKKKTSKK